MKKLKQLMTFLCALLISTTLAFAEPDAQSGLTARTFQFKFKNAERAAAVIKPLMSGDGSLSIQPSSNTLVVTDRTENIRGIVAALEKFDTPAQAFRVEVKLVAASRSATPAVPAELRDVSAKLSGVLRFNAFEKLGELNAEAKEGDPVVVEQFAPGYRAEFRVGEYDPATDTVRVNDFKLQRVQGDGKSSAEVTQVLKTSLNLKLGQTVILGASKLPQSNRALMLVVIAKR